MNINDLNLEKWHLVHKSTGESIDIDLLKTHDDGAFNKVFLNELAAMIDCTGNSSEKVLGWILENKDNKNEIHGTQREIAKEVVVGVATVARIFKALQEGGYLYRKRSGTYFLNPAMINGGGAGDKLTVVKLWSNLT